MIPRKGSQEKLRSEMTTGAHLKVRSIPRGRERERWNSPGSKEVLQTKLAGPLKAKPKRLA